MLLLLDQLPERRSFSGVHETFFPSLNHLRECRLTQGIPGDLSIAAQSCRRTSINSSYPGRFQDAALLDQLDLFL